MHCMSTNLEPVSACLLYSDVRTLLDQQFYYITESLIQQAIKKGIGKDTIKKLREQLNKDEATRLCYCPVQEQEYEKLVPAAEFNALFDVEERKALLDWFAPQGVFSIRFTGEKEWIEPSSIDAISMEPANMNCADPNAVNAFTLRIASYVATR